MLSEPAAGWFPILGVYATVIAFLAEAIDLVDCGLDGTQGYAADDRRIDP